MFTRGTFGVARVAHASSGVTNALFLNRAPHGLARVGVLQRYFSNDALPKQDNSAKVTKSAISPDGKATLLGTKETHSYLDPSKKVTNVELHKELVQRGIVWKEGTVCSSDHLLTHEETEAVKQTHREIETRSDRLAWYVIQLMRKSFDFLSGYSYQNFSGTITEKAALRRIVFLETAAGVPPMMAGMVRHLQSLRLMKKDGGWIQTLLSEAENERMHLMIALTLEKPGVLFRAAVVLTQFGWCSLYFFTYLIAPKFCHRLVGYLEEEAVKTYTHILELLDTNHLPLFKLLDAPAIAKEYYQLGDDAKIREVLARMRADEAHHRDVNHSLSDIHNFANDQNSKSFRL